MPSLQDAKLGFIGGGNMASAIIGGLLERGIAKENIHVSEPWDVNREKIGKMGVRTTTSNIEAGADADLIVIAVKPQVAKVVCEELASEWSKRSAFPIVVSIAAGITMGSIKKWLEGNASADSKPAARVVRVMPNTPALVGEGASGLFASGNVSSNDKQLVDTLFKSVSPATEWVEKEDLLDVVTGLSGSGPAYFFAMVESLIASATALGLPEDQATRLAKQTCFGAGKMLTQSSEDPSQLRKNVTSPNGTTYAGLQVLEKNNFGKIIHDTVEGATKRAAELGSTLGS